MTLDLPMIWAVIIATAVFLYVVLDGFDLGVGILFPLASDAERDVMLASIAPVWDGNETWLVLGGGGLFAAFPLAYATLMPAMYLPIGFMLVALIFRGVAFEFRGKAGASGKRFWTAAFAVGSLVAGLSQGLVLGGFLQGITVEGRSFAGGPWDWLTPFSLLVAVSLAIGYALLGACWLILKTQGELNLKARRWSRRLALGVSFAVFAVSLAMLSVDPTVAARWGVSMTAVEWGTFVKVAPLPALAGDLDGAVLVARRTVRLGTGPAAGRHRNIRHGIPGTGAQHLPEHHSLRHHDSRSRRGGQRARPDAGRRRDHAAGDPGLYGTRLLGVPRQGDAGCGLPLNPGSTAIPGRERSAGGSPGSPHCGLPASLQPPCSLTVCG